ncbi:MAG: PSD1 and planctomycete cytochrome C domain-containing protein [Phycisphaerales bacterium JB040]
MPTSRGIPNPLSTLALATLALAPALLALTLPPTSPESNPATPEAAALTDPASTPPIDFNRDIRPILTDRCFTCHGPDSAAREQTGGLRLDSFDAATTPLPPGVTPIVPGDAAASEAIRRIKARDPAARMPPPESHLTLSPAEIALLERWINDGAHYDTHWSFKPIVAPPVPTIPAETVDPEGGGGGSGEGWSRNEIDRFILARLNESGLRPSPPASRETLIRRLSLDLTGLPPTPEQIDAFLEDRRPDAYERLVDRLLASPHYGERIATMWLDAARYADTLGFHHDNESSQWPWRDWVIESFNTNKPFDVFLTEQLAGDLLPDPTLDQRVATAFNRNHPMTDEGGAIDAEYLVEYAADRVATFSTAVLGLTTECARCHDHKYDPISQDDYYALFAFFNSVEERGLFDRAQGDRDKAFAPFLPAPTDTQQAQLDELSRILTAAREVAQTPIEGLDEQLAEWEAALNTRAGIDWAHAEITAFESTGPSELQLQPDGSVLATGPDPDTDVYEITLTTDETDLNLLRLDALTDPSLPMGRAARASHANAVLSEIQAVATSVADMNQSQPLRFNHAWTSHEQQNGDFGILRAIDNDPNTGWAPAGHTQDGGRVALFFSDEPFGYEGGTVLTIRLRFESVYTKHALGRVRLDAGRTRDNHATRAALPTVLREWFTAGPFEAGDANAAFDAYSGPEGVLRVRTEDSFSDKKWQHAPHVKDGEVYVFNGERRATYFGRQIISPVARDLPISLGSDDALKVWLNGELLLAENTRRGPAPDQHTLTLPLRPGENTLVCKVVNDAGPAGFYFRADQPESAPGPLDPIALVPEDQREPAEAARMADLFRTNQSPVYKARMQAIADAESDLADKQAQVPNVMIMQELDEPRDTYVLSRGMYDQPIESRPVTRRPPTVLGTLPEGAPTNRLGLAQWTTSPDNPLTARVAVNRFWHLIFATGLVKTMGDFGTQGEWPSHPDLLDWLAADFIANGWDVKRLLRQIVTSATYRQSSIARPELEEIDPDNRLLARFPRSRLPAEHIRDQALYASALLNDEIGGDSVKPYQPEGLWAERSMPVSNTRLFQRDSGDDLYRRGMYTFWKRSAPPPQMATFDAPEREFCIVNRGVTNTPLQALVLLNDVTYVEAARALAQRTISESDELDLSESEATQWRITRMARRLTGRFLTASELDQLTALHDDLLDTYTNDESAARELLATGESPRDDSIPAPQHAALTIVASTLLNLDETLTRD